MRRYLLLSIIGILLGLGGILLTIKHTAGIESKKALRHFDNQVQVLRAEVLAELREPQANLAILRERVDELQGVEHCCTDMLSGRCTHSFGAKQLAVANAIVTSSSSFKSSDPRLHSMILEDLARSARVAACGDSVAESQANHQRGCDVVSPPPDFCSVVRSKNGRRPSHQKHQPLLIYHADAVSRRDARLSCLRKLSAQSQPEHIVHCLNLPRDIECTHVHNFGTYTDPCNVCITEELMLDECAVYSIGIGFTWEVENEMADWFPMCKFMLFDPTPESGPHGIVDWANMPTSSTYRDQITVSGKERHQNIWMHRIGVGQEDHIGLFANHFMRNQSGLSTTFLTLESLFKLHGPAFAKPVRPPCKPDLYRNFVTNEISTCPEQALLKLDVEGFEFTFVDQLLALRVPQLSVDFHMDQTHTQHPFSLAALREALVSIHIAGYSVFGPLICDDQSSLKDNSCDEFSAQTSNHDFRTIFDNGKLTKTYIHVNLLLAQR
jgi:hypothetical protein